jgi:hypothetical protein
LSNFSRSHFRRAYRWLQEEFDNGEPYYPLAGREIWLPRGADERPRAELLEWHADEVFRG